MAIVVLYSAQCLAQSSGLQVAKKIETSTIKGSGRQQVKGKSHLLPTILHCSGMQAKLSHCTGGGAEKELPKETSPSERHFYTQCQCSGPGLLGEQFPELAARVKLRSASSLGGIADRDGRLELLFL